MVWIKVGDLFYRISVLEEDAIPWIGLEEVDAYSEEEEEESLAPSEWSEGDENEEDWYVEESIFENGQNGTDNNDRKAGSGDMVETPAGLKSGKNGKQTATSPVTEREDQQSQGGGKAKKNIEETSDSSKVHTNLNAAKSREAACEEGLEGERITKSDQVKEGGPILESGLKHKNGSKVVVRNTESKRQQSTSGGKEEGAGPKENGGFQVLGKEIKNMNQQGSNNLEREVELNESRESKTENELSIRVERKKTIMTKEKERDCVSRSTPIIEITKPKKMEGMGLGRGKVSSSVMGHELLSGCLGICVTVCQWVGTTPIRGIGFEQRSHAEMIEGTERLSESVNRLRTSRLSRFAVIAKVR
ncbi:hypothetical protein L6452_05106 [Arctium lappa]|uniref:Uncharacterized protein n=1 Tax=Arctium lappa TaxID=4217 RepID=A0ACB9EFW9_ARCLA|nr:hypothetical protein L6452_05106 [Arctium lappa]